MSTTIKRAAWTLAVAAAVLMAARAGRPALASGQALGFSTPTVVDPYRPGYEPDLAVDPGTKAGQGATYTSTPFGFSTTESFVYRSDDKRQSFHLTEGNVLGKPTTCIGGGDTELKIDPVSGALYFVDLQGLTNFSASTSADQGATWTTTCTAVNGTAVDRQWLGVDTDGGKNAVGASGGRLYLDYDNTNQSTTQPGGNQLVMNESLDGVHFGGQCQAAGAPCPLPATVISADEGIPGNIVVDDIAGNKYQHRIYAIHTSAAGNSVIVSYCSGASGDTTAAAVAADCTDPTQVGSNPPLNKYWTDSLPRKAGQYLTGNLFASIAIDSGGNLYAVWSEYPVDSNGTENGPGVIKLAVSTDGANSWSAPVAVSPATLGNNVMPWVAAGDAGRIDIAWYGAPQAQDNTTYGPDSLNNGTWNVYLAQSLDALSPAPSFTVTQVSDHQAKFGNISTQGLGGSPDRSLGDFMQVQVGAQGEAVLSYVDDTSADRNPDLCGGCGQTPPEAAGPVMIATQNSGPSLFASVGTIAGQPAAVGSVTDPTGDAYLYFGGMKTAAPPALDITGVAVTQPDPALLQITLSTADQNLAKDLSFSPSLGGPVGEWIVRWAAPAPASSPGDGNIFYVGMESNNGGAPAFYTGTTGAIETTHTKYFVYPKATAITGKITANSIVWTLPLDTAGGPTSTGGMFGITGFTATQLTPSLATVVAPPNGGTVGDENIPNTLDLSPAFSFQPSNQSGSGSSSGSSGGSSSSGGGSSSGAGSSGSSSSSGGGSSGGSGSSSGASSSSSGSSGGSSSSGASSSSSGGSSGTASSGGSGSSSSSGSSGSSSSSGGSSSSSGSGNTASSGGGSGGGAFGGTALLPLLLAALRRRRRGS